MCKLRLAPPRSGPAYTAFPVQGPVVCGPVPPCAPPYTAAPICDVGWGVSPAGEPARGDQDAGWDRITRTAPLAPHESQTG